MEKKFTLTSRSTFPVIDKRVAAVRLGLPAVQFSFSFS